MDQDEKVRVNRLRRMAARRGLRLIRSRQRDPGGLEYGKFRVEDATGAQPAKFRTGERYGLTIDEVEKRLTVPRR
jgi:hypothetical protein